MSQLESAQKLMDEAFRCLEKRDSLGAERIGKELLAIRYSGGFEVLALAYELQGEVHKAVDILNEAVTVVPSVWSLWQLLGNMRSDLSDYDGAFEAYETALKCPNSNVNSVNFNKAVVLHRQKKFDQCLSILASLIEDHNTFRALVLQLTVLNDMGRWQDALDLSEKIRALLPGFETSASDYAYQRAALESGAAAALIGLSAPPDRILSHLFAAVDLDRTQTRALRMITQLRNLKSPSAKLFRLVIKGWWHESVDDSDDKPEFLSTAEVVADNEDEALSFVKEFEPEPVRDSMLVDECTELGQADATAKGVYRLSGHIFVR